MEGKYAGIRQQVTKSLLGHCCADPFPAWIPFSSEDYWRVLRALPSVKPKISAPLRLAFCVLPSALHILTTLRALCAGEEPIFSQLGLLGLLDTLGICDPESPNLAGISLWLQQWEQTAPAANSCVLLVGDCGDSATVHVAGCIPPTGWTVVVTFIW